MEVSGQIHAPAALIPRKFLGTHWKVGWIGPDTVWARWRREKFPASAGS